MEKPHDRGPIVTTFESLGEEAYALRALRSFKAALSSRVAAQPAMSAAMAVVGLLIGVLMVANTGKRVLEPWAPPLLIVGGTFLGWVAGTFANSSSIPRRNAEFWETGALGRIATTASFAACASLAWGMLVWLAFGSIPS